MKYLLFAIIFLPGLAIAQTAEEAEVIATIQQLFDGMRAGDSTAVSALFDPSARLQTAYINREGDPVLKTDNIDKFVSAVGTPHDEIWDERIWSYRINIDDNLATAWTEYTFFLGEKMSHCGVNAFQLFKGTDGWKITQIIDTRRSENCRTEPYNEEVAIHQLLDNWHVAAAEADEDTFFGSMSKDAIYLGTDASERWLRDEMKEWSKKYFERESAWAFTPKDRMVYLYEDNQIAWFEESLDTWMGTCRGSGVVQKYPGGWKLKHYNLAMLVPNDAVDGVIELIEKTGK